MNKQIETFTELEANFQKLAAEHLKRLKERFEKMTELRARCDAELLVLADEIINHGVNPSQRRRSRFEAPACGTDSGYHWHRNRGETCEECKAAHRAHERIASARRRLRKDAA